MKHLSPVGRRLAVAVALAVTAGTAMTAAPALAAPTVPVSTSASVAEERTAPYEIGFGETLSGAGANGFVTYTRSGIGSTVTSQWRRSTDGATTPLYSGPVLNAPRTTAGSDRVAVHMDSHTIRILDMAGGAPVDIDTTSTGLNAASISMLAGDTAVMWRYETGGGMSLHLVSKPAGTVVHRQIAGLPVTNIADIAYSSSGALLVQYGPASDASLQRLAVVDLATAKVVEDRAVPRLRPNSEIAITADHLAWIESDPSGNAILVTARRGSTETTQHTSFSAGTSLAKVFLLGDWAVYGVPGKDVSAVSLKDGTTITGLLDNLQEIFDSGEGLLAQGSTQEHGEGVYRIAPDAEGKPATTLVAARGPRPVVTVVDEQVPAMTGFGTTGAKALLRWQFGRSDLTVNLQLKHKASGKTWTSSQRIKETNTEAAFYWNGTFQNGVAAYNGLYEWTLSATALNGIDQVSRTGTLTVASGTAAHDYSDSGSPDLLVRDASDRLSSYDMRQFLSAPGETWERTDRGGGWNIYDRLLSAGNLDATAHSDVLARDTAGVLWLYSNTGHSLAPRTSVGGGWNIYDKLAAGSDLTGDGRPDLLATDTAGVLWLYKATGDATKPFAPRTRIGGGWGTYDLLTAPGDIGGAKTGDLLARDRSGILWLYLGNGDGTFAPRTKVGGGWNVFDQVVNIGDINYDGHPDLIGESAEGDSSLLTVHEGTGDWRAPFGTGNTYFPSFSFMSSASTRAVLF